MFLVEKVDNLVNLILLKEVGSGLNDKRVQLQKLLKMVANNEVRNVYVTYKDRFTHFWYHYLETMFLSHNVNIIIVKDENADKPVQEELVEDMMSLIASFSGKIRLRRNKILKKVSNLSELVNLVGKDTVDKCFTEYMMLMVAKANKFDKLEQAIGDIDNAHESISIPMQEDDIEYLKEFNITVGGILNNYFDEV